MNKARQRSNRVQTAGRYINYPLEFSSDVQFTAAIICTKV